MALPSLSELKQYLAVSFTADDALIQTCLDSAVTTVERHTGTKIGTRQSSWHDIDEGATRFTLNAREWGEFTGIESIQLRGVNINDAAVDYSTDAGYTIFKREWSIEVLIPDSIWAAFRAASPGGATIGASMPVQIAFTGGLASDDLPDDWKLCIMQLAAETYECRGVPPSGKRVSEVYLRRIAPRL